MPVKIRFFSAAALALAVAITAQYAPAQSPGSRQPSAVQPTATRKTIPVYDALVTLISDLKVPASEAGRLMAVHVKGGERVDEGFVLAEIDNRDTLAKQKIAQAEIDVAKATAKSTAELDVAHAAVEVSKSELESNREINRTNPGAVSLTEMRKFEFQLKRAIAQVTLAETDRHVASLTTGVKEAQLEATANELARRQIAIPFTGEVNEVYRQVGEWVQPGEPIAHVVRLDRVRIKGFVYASEASPIELVGRPVTIKVTTAGGKIEIVQGKIDYASSVVEGVGSSRQFRIWAEVDNWKKANERLQKDFWVLQPGSSAEMEIDMTAAAVSGRPVIRSEMVSPGAVTPTSTSPRAPVRTGTTPSLNRPATTPSTIRPAPAPIRPAPATGKIESFKPITTEANDKQGIVISEPKEKSPNSASADAKRRLRER